MSPIRPYHPSYVETVATQGRLGRSRAEIAAQLGVSFVDFDAWAAEHPAFAQALADADTWARAWWDAQPGLAQTSREPFKGAAWARGYAQRFGRSSDRPPKAAAPKPEPAVETIFEIPDNGRWRRRRKPSAGT
jgi:hypothetical protein